MKQLYSLFFIGFTALNACLRTNMTSTDSLTPGSFSGQNMPEESPALPFGEVSENLVPQSLYDEAKVHISHPLVQKWIEFFTQRDSSRFARFLQRGEYYRPFIEESLKERGLPKELYYLALIESGFITSARSHAQAVGIWQFIGATGRRYGLRIDRRVDQRKDPVASTHAAMSYLSDLYRVYQSWWLAIASYNSGEMSVLRAIMQSGKRDFFDLVEKNMLPRETINYVPKFIAAMHIGRNLREFGIALEKGPVFAPEQGDLDLLSQARVGQYQKMSINKVKMPGLVRHKVRRGENLHVIADRYNISVSKLRRLNSLRREKIFPGQVLKVKARH